MTTAADYLELADDCDRIAAQLTDMQGHAASAGIELPQLVHYAYPVFRALPGTLRRAATVHETDPIQARALPATIGQEHHGEPTDPAT